MDIGIEIRGQITSRLITLDAANDHDGFARFVAEDTVDVKFVVRVGQKDFVDYLGWTAGMKCKQQQ